MASWVQIFDDSFQRVPVRNYGAMYKDGFRVMAGYVAGGTSDKWSSKAQIDAWLALGDDAGFLPLFEAKGDEPLTSPSLGGVHAKAARAGCRARKVPDSSVISPAMDRNITLSQAAGPVAQYMSAWKKADTMPPLPYIELGAGALLYGAGDTAGTGTPAAYDWDPSGALVTPENAPPHVKWTQEHNGVSLHGGNIDIGHIRTDAPIYWRTPMADLVLTAADQETLIWRVQAITDMTPVFAPNSPDNLKGKPVNYVVFQLALKAQIAALPDAIAAKLPNGTIGATPDQVRAIVHEELAKLSINISA